MPLSRVDADIPGWASGILLLAVTISVAGIVDNALSNAGYEFLGIYVWAVCYAGALLVVWFVWLRDIELTGAAGNERKR
jgi:hypothetical protein